EGNFLRGVFAIRHFRLAHQALDFVFATDAFDVDFQVQLSHPGDDRLARFLVGVDAERRVLAAEPLQGLGQFIGAVALHRLDREADDGIRHEDAFQGVFDPVAAERITGRTIHADHGDDVAGPRGIDILAVVRVHADDTPDAGPLARTGV